MAGRVAKARRVGEPDLKLLQVRLMGRTQQGQKFAQYERHMRERGPALAGEAGAALHELLLRELSEKTITVAMQAADLRLDIARLTTEGGGVDEPAAGGPLAAEQPDT